MRQQPVLSVIKLRKSYSGKAVVDAVSFAVRQGEVVGLLGPNGAGKTTILNMVLGLLGPDEGQVSIDGLDIAKYRIKAMERVNFAAVYAPLPGNLTVEQNLRIFGMLYGVKGLTAHMNKLIVQYGLEKFRKTRCGLLSSGEQTRVSLAKAMLNTPRLLLLDEPTASLDPAAAQDIRDGIRDYAANGGSALWTSHNMQEVEAVCDRVLFLSQGRIVLEGNPAGLPLEHGAKNLEELFIRVAKEALHLEKTGL
ncbi:MAG: ABC transporter ATP-binding protein [Betaproteobacteria bacterium]|nr:ABC transporter ATP-binding protein [Betaproteobacteria bacterium]